MLKYTLLTPVSMVIAAGKEQAESQVPVVRPTLESNTCDFSFISLAETSDISYDSV